MDSPTVWLLMLLSQFITLNAQTGAGCFPRSCSDTNKVRIDAIYNALGLFVGGCYCACDPNLYNSSSSLYCAPPKKINYDPVTLTGDCSCICPSTTSPSLCISHTTWNPDKCQCEHLHSHNICIGNQVIDPLSESCVCPEVAADGQFFPICNPPFIRDTITCDCVPTLPPTHPQFIPVTPEPSPLPTAKPTGFPTDDPTQLIPMEIICDQHGGSCSCPAGSATECIITCDGAADACSDSIIDCNNDGYDCIVNCYAESACSGDTMINGPINAGLTVNCIGPEACLGAVQFNGQYGTDLSILCEGSASCHGHEIQLNFGNGIGTLECYGAPDSCQDIQAFNFPTNTIAVGFECIGAFCPIMAPEPFFNPASPTLFAIQSPTDIPTSNPSSVPTNNPTQIPTNNPSTVPTNALILPDVVCTNRGSCGCQPGNAHGCIIHCDGSKDSCSDGVIQCNNDGLPCTVHCVTDNACSGFTKIVGPSRSSLTVYCEGVRSCTGNVKFKGDRGTELTVYCEGGESCNGNIKFSFGTAIGNIYCLGLPDSCNGALFDYYGNGESVQCIGDCCPWPYNV